MEMQTIEECYCPIGMLLEGDQCVACKNNTYGPECSRKCECIINNTLSCDPRTGNCTCLPLWKGKNCSIDIDVCTKYSNNECQKYANCTNTGATDYRCRCSQVDGYIESSNRSCVPINCTHMLTNSTGEIKSPLYPDNYMNNAYCTWNIYAEEDMVISLRINGNSYIYCSEDYLEIYDGDNNKTRQIGHYCYSGIPNVIRTRGNKMFLFFKSDWVYRQTGFYFTYTAHVCRNFTYGTNSCNNLCRCVKENTDFCDNINGECICKPGWTMGDCSMDVNECLGTNNKMCPLNSDCINTRGSYRCECHLGYKFDPISKSCNESKECLYKECSHTCRVESLGHEKCVCPDGLILDSVEGLTCVVPLYPHGKNVSDLLLSEHFPQNSSVRFSSPVHLSIGTPYGNQLQTSVFIQSNGVIQFEPTFIFINPNKDFQTVNSIGVNLIAPYMAETDPNIGRVFYHLYDSFAEKFFGVAQSSIVQTQIFNRAANDLKKYHLTMNDLKINSILIVTWENIIPLAQTSQLTNTFQALYIAGWETENDEVIETAYVLFLYQQGLMYWPYLPNRPIFVGTTGAVKNMLQDLNTTLVSVLGNVTGNTGYKGVMGYKVGKVTGPQQTCKNYLFEYANLLADPVYQNEKRQLYKCPCMLERLGGQWMLLKTSTEDQDIHCYAISMVAKQRLLNGNKRNMLCCYKWTKPATDASWDLWLESWRAATYIPKSSESGHVLVNEPWSTSYFDNQEANDNIRAHKICCGRSESGELCDKFFQIFQDMGCSNFVEFVPASALGDPHITTLDGLTYTMNGWGEYILMDIPSANFTLQARTGRAETQNGTLTNATVFTAFAAKESNESSFQVELSFSKKTLVLMANNIDITNNFYKSKGPDVILSTKSLSVVREYQQNKTLAIVTFPCGVTFSVHVAVKSLLIEVQVLKTFENKIKGLLGNFNGNKTDEFILPNGIILSANMSDRLIYEKFAKNWAVLSFNSIFNYHPGENAEKYQHPDFVPWFMDEADAEQIQQAKEICGDENDACIFDYLVTEDRAFTLNTKDVSEEKKTYIQNLVNSPPTITISNSSLDENGRWNVREGTMSVLQVIGHDEDKDEITFEVLNQLKNISINETGFIHYLPIINNTFLLRVRAKDINGSYSPAISIPIMICPLCSEHGACDNRRLTQTQNGWFQIQACNCFPAYTGQFCESELDACEINPCFTGQSCTDLSALYQGNNTIGYKCGPCPIGYTELLNTCADIDECNSTEICEQKCTNTDGSYICSCVDGYRLNVADKTKCEDINECEEKTSNCEQKCINNPGSYTCSCYPGYKLNSNGQTCTLNVNERDLCYQCQQICLVNNGNQVNCSCKIGYQIDSKDVTNCKDIDECQFGHKPCSQKCVNTEGSYQCSCYTGYKLTADEVTCKACQNPYYGENCANICQCNSRGSCDPVRGCVCQKEWTGASCENDVNECEQPDSCHSGYVCVNAVGTYKCVCPNGYRLDGDQCKDIDECTEMRNITCDPNIEVCINNVGSYSCLCMTGYARNKHFVCEDIDECSSINGCEQLCENKLGTYNCQCYPGFVLADDRSACIKVEDYCHNKNMNCSYGCRIASNNTPICYCPQGYNVTESGGCEDLNECLDDTKNKCSYKNGCVNTNGSYECTCEIGSQLDNDGQSCLTCSGGTWGQECSKSCSCGPGADHCDPKNGCNCIKGFTGILCDQDIDECLTNVLKCEIKEKCLNLPGTAKCICQDGYQLNNGTCQDVNECALSSLNNCSQVCNNWDGSYSCSCFSGYTYNITTNSCIDNDECALGVAKCVGSCINTDGAYRCTCPNDLFLQLDGFSCAAIIQCVNRTDCSHQCAVLSGSETCLCPKGTVLNSDDIHCNDIDLCASTHCNVGCVETNQNTSFECVCDRGQMLSLDKVTCVDCDEGKWGVGCANTCNCSTINTIHCDKVSGNCQCKNGWTGTACDQDVDECRNMIICPALTHCKNTDGGYLCVCDDGYILKNSISLLCEACDEGYYGQSCSKKCSCDANYNCNKTNGSCYCKPGWSGPNCVVDIDECSGGTHTCDINRQEFCTNTPGGYTCHCKDGFFKLNNSCQDIDECNTTQTNSCDQVCINTVGSFKCFCQQGYAVKSTDTMKCEDINECSSNYSNSCEHICENIVGGYNCSCKPGYVVNSNDPMKCDDVDECTSTQINKCQHICRNTDGNYTCACNTGFNISPSDPKNCEDINECENTLSSPCQQVCKNLIGSFQCSCHDRFTINPANSSECIEYSLHSVSMTFDMNVIYLNLESKEGKDYIQLKTEVEYQLTVHLRKVMVSFISVTVIDLRPGSLITDFTVIVNQTMESKPEAAMQKALNDIVSDDFQFNDMAVKAKHVTLEGYTIKAQTCQARSILNPCHESEECITADDMTICMPIKKDSTNLIIGLAVGVPLFVLLCATIVTVVYCATRNQRKPKSLGDLYRPNTRMIPLAQLRTQ